MQVLRTPRLSRLEQCRVIGVHPQPDRCRLLISFIMMTMMMMMMTAMMMAPTTMMTAMMMMTTMMMTMMVSRWEHALRGRELEELEESSVTQLFLSNVWVGGSLLLGDNI